VLRFTHHGMMICMRNRGEGKTDADLSLTNVELSLGYPVSLPTPSPTVAVLTAVLRGLLQRGRRRRRTGNAAISCWRGG
jgi:hypothetical protein